MFWPESIAVILGAVACIVIFIQDIRGRWVHLLPLLLLLVSGLVFRLRLEGSAIWMDLAVNGGFIAAVLGMAWLFFKLRGKTGKFIDEQIGLGDVIMFLAVATWLDSLGFILFFVSGLLLVLALVLALQVLGRLKPQFTVPLAGLLAGYLLAFCPLWWQIRQMMWDWMLLN
jgi:hypothetical protein